MKKLLALVLCVMMFVAVIPTNAFAWEDKAVSSTAVKEAEKSIKNMYTAIATDELVFGTAQSLYNLFDSLAGNLFEGVDSFSNVEKRVTTYHDDLVKNTRKALNAIVGDSIAKYISDRSASFASTTINGGVDPEKYLNVFVAAVNDAVSSEKAQAGIQAFVYDLYALKVYDAVVGEAKDIQTAIKDWGSAKWDEFGASFDSGIKVYNQGNPKDWMVTRDPMTRPGAFTSGSDGAWKGNGTANMSTVLKTILN